MNYIINAYAMQDIGLRTNQEDAFFPPFIDPCHYDETQRNWCYYDGTPHTDQRLFIVCDGMGGHDRGEVASHIVCKTMSNALLSNTTIEGAFSDEMIHHAVDEALDALLKAESPRDVRKMGTTMAMLKFHAEGATIAHIGDSRVYHFRPAAAGKPAKVLFVTKDHTMVNEMMERGEITAAQAKLSSRRHILSRSMMAQRGYRPEADIDHITDIQPGDIFMLCTDGVFEVMDDQELCDVVTDPNYSDVELTQRLLHECLHNRDNHTAYIVRVKDVLNVKGKTKPDSALPAGTVLKSQNYTYEVEKVLGQGAFGITYLVNTSIAMQGQLGTIRTGVKMAMKEFFMHKEMKREGGELIEISPDSKVKSYAERFRNEAEKLASLTHPNIVRVLEVFEANNTIYYTMEYLPGGSLNDYVNKRNGLPEREAIRCIRQIGSALLYIHTNKMLHLDVKPANIMRSDSTGTLKLIDFGLAKRYVDNGDPESSAHLGFGTTGYAPLEQVDRDNEVEFSPAIDVYALGGTYYKLLTAYAPNSAVDVLNNGLATMPLVKKNVSQKSIDAIKAAMQPMKAKRLANVQEFLDMLPRVDDDTIFYEKKARRIRKRWIAAVITLVVGLSAAYYLFFTERKNTPVEAAAFEKYLDLQMVEVEGGTFMMGSDSTTLAGADADEAPRHKVTLSTFYISRYEVTQRQWYAVMKKTKEGRSKNGDYPVCNVTLKEIRKFIERLNEETGRNYRLPTEAEWEYAARGGQQGTNEKSRRGETSGNGNDRAEPDSMAWHAANSGMHTAPVGSLQPNSLGIYDMLGNVWELCSDYYGAYPASHQTNPTGAASGTYHIIRGGSCTSPAAVCRPTYRQDTSLEAGSAPIGFRLVLPAVKEE